MYEVVALMPMRHTSSRVKGKNYRPFGDGRPLFAHMASKLIKSTQISKVLIDTDSPTISDYCKEHFPTIDIINRPENLRNENCPMNDIILHDISKIESKYYIQTHSTNPLLSIKSIDYSIKTFRENHPTYDSLFSVTKTQSRFWDSTARAINHNPKILMRTQDLPPIYEENSCIYIFNRESLEKYHNRIGERPYLFELPSKEATDIDEEFDFEIAEMFFHQQEKYS
tara:strand:+ start:593 stop:1270 length:678 start_codon:yes stop_codon:yes gene_type:complete